jgi:hypothetical protein
MSELAIIVCLLIAWGVSYLALSRFLFRARLKPWERFEDMTNEGCQTTLLLVVSGFLAAAAVVALVVWQSKG